MTFPVLYIGPDQVIDFDQVRKQSDGSFINAGTANWEIHDQFGVIVGAGGTLTYLVGSDGHWQGLLGTGVSSLLQNGKPYTLYVTFTDGTNVDVRNMKFTA